MKRIISVICVVLCLATVLCACDTKKVEKEQEEIKELVGTKLFGEDQEEEEEEENVFYNPTNYQGAADTVDIRPCRLYWEDGQLVAECFVINSKNTTAYNINVKELYFGNEDGIFAKAAFGVMDGATIAPNSYITWTFHFGSDVVSNYDADLTNGIEFGNRVSFYH